MNFGFNRIFWTMTTMISETLIDQINECAKRGLVSYEFGSLRELNIRFICPTITDEKIEKLRVHIEQVYQRPTIISDSILIVY